MLLASSLITPRTVHAQGEKKIRVSLKNLTAQSLHNRMEKVLRRQIATSQDPTGNWLGFHIDQAEGPRASKPGAKSPLSESVPS